MSNLKNTIEYLNDAIEGLKKLEDERDSGKNEDAEEKGIKKTMRYLKDECRGMSLTNEDGYFVEENELNEDDEWLIEGIKQM